jgi:uncharacterized membrane protein
MLQIIFILSGVYIIAKGKINFSTKRELVRPRSTYIGIALLLLALFLFVFKVNFFIGIIFFIVIFIISYFLSQNIADEDINKDARYKYSRLAILWLILLIPSLCGFLMSMFLFDTPDSGKSLFITQILALSLLTAPPSLLIGAVFGYFNRKRNKDYILVYLPFVNICAFFVTLILLVFLCSGQLKC